MACNAVESTAQSKTPSNKAIKVAAPTPQNEQIAVFAGGCFWGVEAVFEHTKGVTDVTSGYSGGTAKTANYEDVSNGTTKHAEAVQIKFDSTKISYTQLLEVFFTVAHNPTELLRKSSRSKSITKPKNITKTISSKTRTNATSSFTTCPNSKISAKHFPTYTDRKTK